MKVGDRVRSFDFVDPDLPEYGRWLLGEHERASYIEGELVSFEEMEGCTRAVILVDLDVFGDKVRSPGRVGRKFYPPANGTLVLGCDNPSNGIEVIS